jgi:glycosyltransferase involved in cell wall biosynthesis
MTTQAHDSDGPDTSPARLLYIGEFPPSNHHGGAILIKRLLDQYPAGGLTVITSRVGMRASQATGLIDCPHVVLPAFDGSAHFLIRSFTGAANWLSLFLVALKTIVEVKRKRVEALLTIVQGRYYFAAAFAAWTTATPHITIVHDNFTAAYISRSETVRRVKRYLTATILRSAAHIYAVSPEMQRLVWRECGAESEIQLPSTAVPARQVEIPHEGGPIILFAGVIGYTVKDSLDLLANLIKTRQLEKHGICGSRLHLCTTLTEANMRAFGWDHEDIVIRGWIPQSELASVLASADILFLPYSFLEGSRDAVETAFPSKTADYLAAGKPILVFGPKYSSLVRYASEQGFAEVVDEFSPDALAQGIGKIICSSAYREQLADRALKVFSASHDVKHQREKFYLTLEDILRVPRAKRRLAQDPKRAD